ncbi:MAG: PEP-CTERM sorting domain-containing protein [Pirellulales bacterium]|nr:PEP-CTERM sorting domain-containing protein [Pirellulales bacterium]
MTSETHPSSPVGVSAPMGTCPHKTVAAKSAIVLDRTCWRIIVTSCFFFLLVASTAYGQIDRWFTVQPIQVHNDFGLNPAPMPLFQAETEKIFSQAGVAPIWLPTVQVNDSSMLVVSGVNDVNVPGNGQHADPLTVNMWFVEDLDIGPDWILYGEAYIDGNGVAINGTEVQNFNGGIGRLDTVAHEIGHNLNLSHSSYGAGGSENLVTSGSVRDVPDDILNITPDGDNLSQLTAAQITELRSSPFLGTVAEVLVDTNGSTPYSTDDFFLLDFASGPGGMSLSSLTMDLSPVAAFFDPTATDPGAVGTPFALNSASMVGVAPGDISVSGDTDGSQLLTLDFASGSFTEGDSFRFGIDVDLLAGVDNYGATPEELMGTLFTFEFDSGLLSVAEIEADLIASSIEPISNLSFVNFHPIIREIQTPFEWYLDPDPVRAVPEPSTAVLIGLGLVLAFARNGRKQRINR